MAQLRFIAAEVSRGLSAADAHRLLADRSEGGQSLTTDGRNGGTRLLVLLAERDPVAADLAEFFLRTEGYEVHLALAVGDAEQQWLITPDGIVLGDPVARDRSSRQETRTPRVGSYSPEARRGVRSSGSASSISFVKISSPRL
jgi:hypothetical protein